MSDAAPRMRIFTPGPVMMWPETLRLGAQQTPYFRNAAFSAVVQDCERRLLQLAHAPDGSRCVFITGAGTAAMEAAVCGLVDPERGAGVVNGGSFGQRFVDICAVHRLPAHVLTVDRDPLSDGTALAQLPASAGALLVNAHETSVGHCYDLGATAAWCAAHDALHVVDAISLFMTDPLDMQADRIDALIVSSHKGLALPPGLAMVLLAPRALARVRTGASYYLDLAAHLGDGVRGQTPFTPAVTIMLQLQQRLTALCEAGPAAEWARVAALAARFRAGLAGLPLRCHARHMPNAMTALALTGAAPDAPTLVRRLEVEYGCVVAPNGGALASTVFRVGHMGALEAGDIDHLLAALQSLLGVL